MQTKPAKILGLLSCLLLTDYGFSQSDQRARELDLIGRRIVNQARRDVGTQEKTWRNDNPLFDYYRVQGGNKNVATDKGWKDAYCAYGVYAWHLQAGIKPPVKSLGKAISWSNHPTRINLGRQAKPDDLKKLSPGWVIGFYFGSNHVGVIEEKFALYATTIEANTSVKNSIGSYKTKNEGVIRKRRFFKDAGWATDWRSSPKIDSLPALKLRSKFIKSP